jgi:hypothetical protein
MTIREYLGGQEERGHPVLGREVLRLLDVELVVAE